MQAAFYYQLLLFSFLIPINYTIKNFALKRIEKKTKGLTAEQLVVTSPSITRSTVN